MTLLLAGLQITYVLNVVQLLAIGTFGLTPIEGVYAILLCFIIFRHAWYGIPFRIPLRIETIALFLMWGAFAASSLWVAGTASKPFVVQSLKTFSHFTFLWLGAIVLYCIPINAEQWRSALRVNLIVSAVVAVYAMYQIPARAFDLPMGWIDITNASFKRGIETHGVTTQLALQFQNFFRATSVFSEPSALAIYSSSALALVGLPILLSSKGLFTSRVFVSFTVIVLLIALLLAFSLNGVILVVASTIYVLVRYPKATLLKISTIFVAGCLVLATVNYIMYAVTDANILELFEQRITSIVTGKAADIFSDEAIVGESLTQRLSDYSRSIEAWTESPIFGVGPGCFSLSHAGSLHNEPFVSTTYGSVLAELGAVGFVCFMILIVAVFLGILRDEQRWSGRFAQSNSALSIIAPFLPVKMIQILIICANGNLLISALFWTDLVMLLSCQTLMRKELGVEKEKLMYILDKPLRTTVTEWLRKGAMIGSDIKR